VSPWRYPSSIPQPEGEARVSCLAEVDKAFAASFAVDRRKAKLIAAVQLLLGSKSRRFCAWSARTDATLICVKFHHPPCAKPWLVRADNNIAEEPRMTSVSPSFAVSRLFCTALQVLSGISRGVGTQVRS